MTGQAGIEPQLQPSGEHISIDEQVAKYMVAINGLKKSFGFKPVLRGIDLAVEEGTRVALLGANGAGKTTLLRMLAGLLKPHSGTIRIADMNIVQHAQEIRQIVGFVGHQPYVYEELTAQENLLFFARMYHVGEAEEKAHLLLRRVGLAKRARERVGSFSRGQLQRLAWARALLHSPRLLLLDEPDTGLDQEGQELVDTLLADFTQRGGSTIFTTHQLERAIQLSDRVVILNRGRVAYQQEQQMITVTQLQQIYNEVVR